VTKAPNQAKIDPDLIKTVSITLENYRWLLIELSILFLRQNSQVRTCNNFPFLNSHRAC